MFEILCNGILQPWQGGVMLVPTSKEDGLYLKTRELYNADGCFSFISIPVKGFTITYYFCRTRKAVRLDFKYPHPNPQISTSLLNPSVFIRRNNYSIDKRKRPEFYVGFRCRQESSLQLQARKQYAWCTINFPVDCLKVISRQFLGSGPLYADLIAWMNSEFQVHPAQIQGTAELLSVLDDILHFPLEGVIKEEYQYGLLRAFSREVLYRMADSCVKVGRMPSGFPHESEVLRAAAILDEHLIKPPSVPNLAKRAGSNPTTLRAGFKSVYGESIRHYTSHRRLQVALQLLCSPYLTETDIARQSGYGSASAMVKAFNRELGGAPGSFKIAKNMLVGTTTI